MGGEGLGFVFTDFLAASCLNLAWSFAGKGGGGVLVLWDGCCGWRLCVSRYLFGCLGICGGIAVSQHVLIGSISYAE